MFFLRGLSLFQATGAPQIYGKVETDEFYPSLPSIEFLPLKNPEQCREQIRY